MNEKKKKSERTMTLRDFRKGAAAGAVMAAVLVLCAGLLSCDDGSENFTYQGDLTDIIANSNVSSTVQMPEDRIITSPYADVDWETFDQYKAALHTHSTRSDGANTLAQMIEELYRQDYDIVAMTDHDIVNVSWTTGLGRLDTDRYNAMVNGTAPKRNLSGNLADTPRGRGILRIPLTNEQSRSEHINSFFASWNNASGATLEGNISNVENVSGISFLNKGDYTAIHTGSIYQTSLDRNHHLTTLTPRAGYPNTMHNALNVTLLEPYNRSESSSALIVEASGTQVTVRGRYLLLAIQRCTLMTLFFTRYGVRTNFSISYNPSLVGRRILPRLPLFSCRGRADLTPPAPFSYEFSFGGSCQHRFSLS